MVARAYRSLATRIWLLLLAADANLVALVRQTQQRQQLHQQMTDIRMSAAETHVNLAQQFTMEIDRVVPLEANLGRVENSNQVLVDKRLESMDAFRGLPAALTKLSKGSDRKLTLLGNRGLSRPYVLGDGDPDTRFRMWATKFEDFVSGILGERWREAMAWAAEQEANIFD